MLIFNQISSFNYLGKDFKVIIVLSQQRFTRDFMHANSLIFSQFKKAIEQAVLIIKVVYNNIIYVRLLARVPIIII